MKNYLKRFVILLFMGMWAAVSHAQEEKNHDLFGVISKSALEQQPFSSWFSENNQNYQVDEMTLAGLDELLGGVEIKIAMGTWCHDSKREIPRFYKILSGAHESRAQMIALDRQKRSPAGEIDGMGITNTPTIIFYKNGKELNRIVERPIESLEKDMVKILRGEEYRHSKLVAQNE